MKLPLDLLVGQTRQQMRRQLGEPDRTGEQLDTFFHTGLIVNYRADEVVGFTISLLVEGPRFEGKVFGIGLDSSKKQCRALWGEPVAERVDSAVEYNSCTWRHQGYVLDLEIWRHDGQDDSFGVYHEDTVKSIKMVKE